ncbi:MULTISPECIES: hypothetical protein [Pseudomonas]|uniref:Uncharacterized protein n=1 Tax=Pseudomonas poae TaxID=200451 RepID=A0AAP2S6E6_9PSED|nr:MULTISPECIES: hypothetical protein [Pseudomonas]MCF5657742.1 hypothetical protein [Pseudomonas poae]MCF5778888.1 hypothetical protein [Pseudomonas poae]
MQVRITETFANENASHVKFRSPVGDGIGVCTDASIKTGARLDVELDLDEVFSWGRNIRPSLCKTPQIMVINGITHITAKLIQSSDNEFAALQVGDSIILIELDGPMPQEHEFVDLKAAKIHLYPTNI